MGNHTKIDSSGNPREAGYPENVKVIAAATTLTKDDHGKLLVLNAAAGAAVTLPAVATSSGLHFKFIVGAAFATTNWTIVALTNVIQGNAVVVDAIVPAVNENTISFVASAETIGDYVELHCDGTNWYVSGLGTLTGSITFTAP